MKSCIFCPLKRLELCAHKLLETYKDDRNCTDFVAPKVATISGNPFLINSAVSFVADTSIVSSAASNALQDNPPTVTELNFPACSNGALTRNRIPPPGPLVAKLTGSVTFACTVYTPALLVATSSWNEMRPYLVVRLSATSGASP